MNLREKKQVIFSYAMVNLGILKITFNCFLTYKAIQTRPLVLLVDSPYKSCIAPSSDPPRACWCQCTWYKWYFFQCKWPYKRQMKENDDSEKNIKFYHMHIYYFIDVSLKNGGRGVMGFFLNKSRSYCTKIHYLITFYKIKFTKTSTNFFL